MFVTFDPAGLAAPVQSVVDAYQVSSASAAVVARVTGPNQTAFDSAGVTDTATGRPALANQSFEVGSQTKMMTATIILQLVGEGKIDLDAAAGNYLDTATKNGIANIETATVRNLLNMKSGIDDYTTVPGKTDGIPAFIQEVLDHPNALFTATNALGLVRGLPAIGTPGTDYQYSNTNYTLLGQIIEQATGKSLAENLQTRIFDPAGMTHSTTDETPSDANRLHQYLTDLEGKVIDVTDGNWRKGAEGGVVSTTEDMTKFLKALLIDKTLLSADLLAEMTTNNNIDTGTPELQSSFGLGISAFKIDGIGWVTGFTGGTLGTDSSTYVDLATGRIIAVGITNADASSALVARDIWLASKDGAWDPVTFDPAVDTLSIGSKSAAQAIVSGDANVTITFGEAAITLPAARATLTSGNVTFKDGSVLVIGDNGTGTSGDGGANIVDILTQFAAAANQDNQLIGLGGDDTLAGGNGADKIDGGDGNDQLFGRNGNDRFDDGAGRDRVSGGAGNDRFSAGLGDDTYTGGAGIDTVSFAGSSAAVTVSLATGRATGAGTDTLMSIENVTGSGQADRISGDSGDNRLFGLGGNDVVRGGKGHDVVSGGLGKDVLAGGGGDDVFVFRSAAEAGIADGHDIIADFRSGDDRIHLADIDANGTRSGNQAFHFIGTEGFHKIAGELHAVKLDRAGSANDVTVVAGDTNGDGKADFQIELKGLHTLQQGDFIL